VRPVLEGRRNGPPSDKSPREIADKVVALLAWPDAPVVMGSVLHQKFYKHLE